ncbi:hypothetical protein F5Y03DRAFT_392015 [Xylaria venustula]|nr:hypothetical protein F5Y03DRAFT_392015 [Xylaria venustula]
MSVSFRVGVHLKCGRHLRRPSAATVKSHHMMQQKPVIRHISWMPFEQPDPSLYATPPSLQPKRPLTAEVVSSTDGAIPQTPVTGQRGAATSSSSTAAATAARTQEDPASSKPVPTSVPASSIHTGPTPLSQVQKRTLATTARRHGDGQGTKAGEAAEKGKRDTRGQSTSEIKDHQLVVLPKLQQAPSGAGKNDDIHVPNTTATTTLHLRIPRHPTTWPDTGDDESEQTPHNN